MIFKTRPGIVKQFDTIHNFGIKNLVVSGCSFTYNNHETIACAWPYYLRDLGGFDQVFDTSLPGAGNSHISDSLIWSLEIDRPDPTDSLVIVMWSGPDRDDYICPISNSNNQYSYEFRYSDQVLSALTAGNHPEAIGNTITGLKELSKTKTNESRAIENYLYMTKTYQYLKSCGYKFIFLNFLNPNISSLSQTFDIKQYLPKIAQKKLDQMFEKITDPYTYAVKNDLLWDDDFHPSPDGQLNWTRKVLLPKLQKIII